MWHFSLPDKNVLPGRQLWRICTWEKCWRVTIIMVVLVIRTNESSIIMMVLVIRIKLLKPGTIGLEKSLLLNGWLALSRRWLWLWYMFNLSLTFKSQIELMTGVTGTMERECKPRRRLLVPALQDEPRQDQTPDRGMLSGMFLLQGGFLTDPMGHWGQATLRTATLRTATLRTRLWVHATLRTCNFEDMRLWGQKFCFGKIVRN